MSKVSKNLLIGFLVWLLVVQPLAATYPSVTEDKKKATDSKAADRGRKRPRDDKKSKASQPSDSQRTAGEKRSKRDRAMIKVASPTEIEGQSATLLPDGRWLLLGGRNGNDVSGAAVIKDAKDTEILGSTMNTPREGHSATLLPNGNVLVLGGRGANGDLITTSEIFNPDTLQFDLLTISGLTPRAGHSAVLLTSGSILIAGGAGIQKATLRGADLLSTGSFEIQRIEANMRAARNRQQAELQSDGTVLFSGGTDENLAIVPFYESFDPETGTFAVVGEPPPPDHTTPATVVFSSPANGENSASVNSAPVLRFSKRLRVKSANSETVRLTESGTVVSARVVPAEAGRLLFITPQAKLKPNTTYHIELSSLLDEHDLLVPDKIIAFKTEEFCELPQTPPTPPPHHHSTQHKQVIDEDTWIPGDDRFKEKKPEIPGAPPLEAPKNITALSGRVLSLSGKPLLGVTLVLQGKETQTDSLGRFLLTDLKPGQSGMVIHGETVDAPGKTYGTFEVLVDVDEGKTNVLPYVSYLPVIDKDNEVSLDAPTRKNAAPNDFVGTHTETPTAFYKAELRFLKYPQIDQPSGGWEVKMRDGTRLIFRIKYIPGYAVNSLHEIIDRFGNKLVLLRDDNLRLLRITSPNNKWIEYTYYANSDLVSQIRDNIGRTVSYTYDEQKRLTKVTDVMGGETFYTYDGAHRMLTMKDARGTTNLINEYDYAGRVKKQTLADGTIYQFAYTLGDSSKVVQTDVTNPRGLVRRMNFNDKAYPVSEVFGVGRPDAWGFTYERDTVSNRILRVTDTWDQKTSFNYDSNGNMLSSTYLEDTPDAITTSATYTDFDNVATTTDVLNRTSSFSYDTRGQLTAAADWLNRSSSFTYNDRGQLLTATDNLNRTSRFTYDRGALVESEDPTGRKVRRYIDNAGRVTRTYDPMGGVAKYRYNKVNRPTHVTDPLGRTAALLHDAVGNILEITDSKGGKIRYTYDPMSRPLTRTDQLDRVETYQYDAYGNLWKATDHKGQITEFSYDVFNRPTLVRYHDNTTTAYSYDEKARVSSVTDSASGTITYGYDAYDRVNSETMASGTVNYAYDAGGRQSSMKAPNQALVVYSYDTADRVQSITQDGQIVSFTYDDVDRRLSMTLPNGIVAYYTYDTASQLRSLTYKRGMTVLGDVSFEYDANGRRTHVSGSLAQILSPGIFDNTSYDAANQQNVVNAQSLTYDQNGNLLSDGTNTYTWNARDELVAMSGLNLTASFAYDGEGRRVSKTINGLTTTYVYDGLQAVEEHEQAGPVTTQVAGGLDEVFFRKTGTNSEFLLTDALGSTWGLADNSGNVNTEYKYDVFGQTQTSGQASNNPLQYTGRENDGTGLYYYRNRYYSPSLRRFISRDPLREIAGENEYSYVGNSPANSKDPLGLYPTASADIQPPNSSSWPLGNNCQEFLPDWMGYNASTDNGRWWNAFWDKWNSLREDEGPAIFGSYGGGPFSVSDWSGYPGSKPPNGPFRLLDGAEYDEARRAANKENQRLHRMPNSPYDGKQIHEKHPIKFGGSPTDPNNKVGLPQGEHAQYNRFWNRMMRSVRFR